MRTSSSCSTSGAVSSSWASSAICRAAISRALLTESHSPMAMEHEPAARPARPASRIVWPSAAAPATPMTRLRFETRPSLAPRTAARRALPPPPRWRSVCGAGEGSRDLLRMARRGRRSASTIIVHLSAPAGRLSSGGEADDVQAVLGRRAVAEHPPQPGPQTRAIARLPCRAHQPFPFFVAGGRGRLEVHHQSGPPAGWRVATSLLDIHLDLPIASTRRGDAPGLPVTLNVLAPACALVAEVAATIAVETSSRV